MNVYGEVNSSQTHLMNKIEAESNATKFFETYM